MKIILLSFTFLIFTFSTTSLNAQEDSEDSTGLPGDNFSLQGALAMFEKAGSPEEFEKLLNNPDNHVNNLDLNSDGEIDYIRVIDKSDGKNHVFILQVPVSEKESQDIAVIELEKTGDQYASLQIIGDEDIYGEQKIVEPGNENADTYEDKANTGGPGFDPDNIYTEQAGLVVNVWFWPCVRFVYTPSYTLWVSPWRWRHYPIWWQPWRPVAWRLFYPSVRPYHKNFLVVTTHRTIRAGSVYRPYRTTSVIVRNHNRNAVNHYRVSRTTIRKSPVER